MITKKSYRNAYTGREAVYVNFRHLFRFSAKNTRGWDYNISNCPVEQFPNDILLIDALNTPLIQELFSHG